MSEILFFYISLVYTNKFSLPLMTKTRKNCSCRSGEKWAFLFLVKEKLVCQIFFDMEMLSSVNFACAWMGNKETICGKDIIDLINRNFSRKVPARGLHELYFLVKENLLII